MHICKSTEENLHTDAFFMNKCNFLAFLFLALTRIASVLGELGRMAPKGNILSSRLHDGLRV